MPVTRATDHELRNLIFDNPKVIVKFTKTDCPVCERMGQTYLRLSQDPQYQDTLFLLMDASENPVSSQEVHLTGTPFFAVYRGAILVQCKLASDEESLKELLQQLHE